MSRGYLPVADNATWTKTHFTASSWAQWHENAESMVETRGRCVASSCHLDVPIPNVRAEVARFYWVATPDETHVRVQLTVDSSPAIPGSITNWQIRTQSTAGANVATSPVIYSSHLGLDQAWYLPRSRCVHLAQPNHYESTRPITTAWLTLAHAAGLPRDRVLIVYAESSGGHLRGVVAYGLRSI